MDAGRFRSGIPAARTTCGDEDARASAAHAAVLEGSEGPARGVVLANAAAALLAADESTTLGRRDIAGAVDGGRGASAGATGAGTEHEIRIARWLASGA